MKNYDTWNELKKEYDAISAEELVYFSEREIWWMTAGLNIGTEVDGKHEKFARPVLIIKKFNKFGFIGVPLSTTLKVNKYHYKITFLEEHNSVCLLSQIKTIDTRRLLKKIGMLDERQFSGVKKAVRELFS